MVLFLFSNSEITKSLPTYSSNNRFGTLEKPTDFTNQYIKYENENPFENSLSSSDILIEANITKSGDYFDGYNLFVLGKYPKKSFLEFENVLLITDMDGNIIRKREYPSYAPFSYLSAEFINSTTVMYGSTRNTTILWNIYTNDTQVLPIGGHHEIEYNAIDNTFFTFKRYNTIINDTSYMFDKLEEYDISGSLIWEIDTGDFIDPIQECPYHDMNEDNVDLTHSNTIFFDAEEDVLYYNSRNVNTFYKINHTDGNVIWGVGEYGNFTLFNKKGIQKSELFFHAHAIEKIDENRFILFDNDFHNQSLQDNYRSRMLEITIDEDTMTANESWSFEAPTEYFCGHWGDADLLANGNRLGTFGTRTHPNTDINARLVEVNQEGEIVWEMNFPDSEFYLYGLYRAERIRLNPILLGPSNTRVLTGSDISINWKTQYNFRTKISMQGSYEVYLNETLFDSDVYYFDKFWRTKDLVINLGILSKGAYNITLVLKDESDISSRSNFVLEVADYFINRQGPTSFEKGHINSMINWTGDSLTELDYNITSDGSLVDEGKWANHTIELDLDTLNIGEHQIVFQLFNNSLLLYIDNFTATVHPFAAPEITTFPSDQEISWGFSTLEWEIFDNTPLFWEIYINNIIHFSDTWHTKNLTIIRDFSFLDESLYNITIIAVDRAFQKTKQTSWIEIIPPSPPIISSFPSITKISWGTSYTFLNWTVHGGNEWVIWKNGMIFLSEEKTENVISILVDEWKNDELLPGKYNLTLIVKDDFGGVAKDTIIIDIFLNLGDPYADEVIITQTTYCQRSFNALEAPDGLFSILYIDYSNGYITLDMGEDEEIFDGIGDDFRVIGGYGNYRVWISNDLSQPFTAVGTGSGNKSFDLSDASTYTARYIRIEIQNGDYVELDAIIALNYNLPESDTLEPMISGPENFWVWENQSSVIIDWEAYDHSPWNYSILLSGSLLENGSWNGDNIIYEYYNSETGTFKFTLILYDLFGNSAKDDVILTVRPLEGLLQRNLIIAIVIPILSLSIIGGILNEFIYKRRKMLKF
jgi:hypothetical protein